VPRNSLFDLQGISIEAFEFTRPLGIKDVAKCLNLQNFPDTFPVSREMWGRDGFAVDCIVSQAVQSLRAMCGLQK